ncbi:hypothetical protein OF83DRAFT_1281643 [Amylostereum chailletii]|nr:hypothetical protein OF83DRAFT_1281643 [Amylostereum chailletii]
MPTVTPPTASMALQMHQPSNIDLFDANPLGLFRRAYDATSPAGGEAVLAGVEQVQRYAARATRDRSIRAGSRRITSRSGRRSSPPSEPGPSNYGGASASARGLTLGKRSKREPEDQVDLRPSKRAAHDQTLFGVSATDGPYFGLNTYSKFSVTDSTLQAPPVQQMRSSEQTANN